MVSKQKRVNEDLQESTKDFICKVEGCDKRYSKYPSLYTHVKLKHPDQPLQLLVPNKNNIDTFSKKSVLGQKQLSINKESLILLQNPYFLQFYKDIKDIELFNQNIHDYFLSENNPSTILNDQLIAKGAQENLKVINKAKKKYNLKQQLENIQNNQDKDSVDGYFNKARSVQTINSNVSQQQSEFSDISAQDDSYMINFFIIAKELIKPLNQSFSVEILYMFDKIIERAQFLRWKPQQEFEDDIVQQLQNLISNNPEKFKTLLKHFEEKKYIDLYQYISPFCNQFAKNISGIFIKYEIKNK